ncbi:MAG: hypothetical protein HXX13_00020 [Bacteroidetes bacterium]|nr:hypothetical protein [Bacteroidota bacterium]
MKPRTSILITILSLAICCLGSIQVLVAQNAPVTTIATVTNAVAGQAVDVPVTVTGFNGIGSFTLTFDYDYSKLHFVSGTQSPSLSGTFSIGDNDMGNGTHRLVMGWFGNGSTLPDGTVLVNITFTYLSDSPLLEWYEMGPSCEYTDESASILNDSPTSTYYINGRVCGAIQSPGTISGNASICQGSTGVIYNVAPIANVQGYSWSVPEGASIVNGLNTNYITVDYSSAAVSGNVSVSGINDCGPGPVSVLPVLVHILPVANAGNDTTIGYSTSIQLHAASGGAGSYGYHWSPENLFVDPLIQNPQTIQLTSSVVFQLLVTDLLTLCQASDDKPVTISGGVLSANPTVTPGEICRQQLAQLFANAGGGSGAYTYSWTCTPQGNPGWSSTLPSPLVSPDTTTVYSLMLSDGFNDVFGSVSLIVNPLPSAFVSGGGSACDDGTLISVRVDLTGTPPWSISYSNGLNNTTVNGINTSPYFINTSIPGTYSIIHIEDMHCTGTSTGEAVVAVIPLPAAPAIQQVVNTLYSNTLSGNQWYKDDLPITGAEQPYYNAEENGLYYDIVTQNGCTSDTSNKLEVLITSAILAQDSQYRVFPIPASDFVCIEAGENNDQIVELSVVNNNGLEILSRKINGNCQTGKIVISTTDLNPGAYLLKIKTKTTIHFKKMLILRK